MKQRKKGVGKKVFFWIIAILVIYVFTSAKVSRGVVEVEKRIEQKVNSQEQVVVEKLVKTTKYVTQKIPFGPTRCEMMWYNYSYKYSYTEDFVSGQKVGTCRFDVKNEEDMAGNFTFYTQFLQQGRISDSNEIAKPIEALSVETFQWSLEIDPLQTMSCLLRTDRNPKRIKCFYLEPITYQIKEMPVVVEELKNVTEFVPKSEVQIRIVKENVTANIYTNRFFGYGQFFYFGY